MSSSSASFVKVIKTILGKEQSEGVGARVIRTIGGSVSYHDPFLLLDEFKVAKPAGFPNHPHRGKFNLCIFNLHPFLFNDII